MAETSPPKPNQRVLLSIMISKAHTRIFGGRLDRSSEIASISLGCRAYAHALSFIAPRRQRLACASILSLARAMAIDGGRRAGHEFVEYGDCSGSQSASFISSSS